MNRREASKGYVLLPVILILAVIGTMAQLMSLNSAETLKEVGTVHSTEQAKYAAEAGLALARKELAQDDDCAAYDVTSQATFNGIDYITSVTPVSGSPVTLTVSVDHGAGVSKQFSKQVTMYQSAPDLLLNPSADAYIDEANNGTNYGSNEKLKFQNPSDKDYLRSLLQFDLSAVTILPQQIYSASLDLYLDDSGDTNTDEIAAFIVTEEWTEVEVSWNKRTNGDNWSTEGGVFNDEEVTRTLVDESIAGVYSWALTDLTKAWLAGDVTNYGVLLKNTTINTNSIKFVSREFSDSVKWPVLRIKYRCECGQVCS